MTVSLPLLGRRTTAHVEPATSLPLSASLNARLRDVRRAAVRNCVSISRTDTGRLRDCGSVSPSVAGGPAVQLCLGSVLRFAVLRVGLRYVALVAVARTRDRRTRCPPATFPAQATAVAPTSTPHTTSSEPQLPRYRRSSGSSRARAGARYAHSSTSSLTVQMATKGSALEVSEGVVARHRKNGAIVGSVLFWPMGPSHAGIGMMIVDKAHQSRGLGRCVASSQLYLMRQASLSRDDRAGRRSPPIRASSVRLPSMSPANGADTRPATSFTFPRAFASTARPTR